LPGGKLAQLHGRKDQLLLARGTASVKKRPTRPLGERGRRKESSVMTPY